MRADAELAQQQLAPMSPFRAGALFLEGVTYLLEGDPERADPIIRRSVDVAIDFGVTPAAVSALAERAVIAVGRSEWEAARAHAERAIGLIEAQQLEGYLEACPAYAVAARIAVHEGDPARAKELIARAARLRPLLTYALPHSALWLLEMAKAYVELADAAGARAVLREVRDILHQRPDLGIVAAQCAELQAAADRLREGVVGASSLTNAELRLLPLLSTHLSFQEIGERLFVSRNTVKTHAMSIYQKLGVASRSEAIARVQEIGLL